MTDLANLAPSQTFGDLITCTNNGEGLTNILSQIQDGFGHASPISLSTIAINFNRMGGNMLLLDTLPLTASAVDINSMCNPNPVALGTGALTLPRGNTFQRPANAPGLLRFNTNLNLIEVNNGVGWNSVLNGGNVVGPGASTDNALVRWDGVSGQLIEDSNLTVTTAGLLTTITCANFLDINSISDLIRFVGSTQFSGLASFRVEARIATGAQLIFESSVGPFNPEISFQAGATITGVTYTLPRALPVGLDNTMICDPVTFELDWMPVIQGSVGITDNALVRWDVTGTRVQNSSAILNDAGALSGLTQLDVGNLRLSANTILTTNVDGNLILDTNGFGNIELKAPVLVDYSLSAASISIYDSGRLSFFNGENFITFEPPAGPYATQDYKLPTDAPPGPGYFMTCDPVTKQLSWAIP